MQELIVGILLLVSVRVMLKRFLPSQWQRWLALQSARLIRQLGATRYADRIEQALMRQNSGQSQGACGSCGDCAADIKPASATVARIATIATISPDELRKTATKK